MSPHDTTTDQYAGFEQGPIRPPSEAHSLLIRITRNCPWNRCTFCPVYKGSKFSIRPVDHVKRDIDAVHRHVESLLEFTRTRGTIPREEVNRLVADLPQEETEAFGAALRWIVGGMKSVFLQDANSLVIKPTDLVEILVHLRRRFPTIERITSYARSQTVARISDEDMLAIAQAGLNRIHIGLESGSDQVLEMVKKGVTKAKAVEAGRRVKRAGIQLSEYYIPGLGGQALWQEHATETADALNQIDPDFIRLRSLAIPGRVPLFEQWRSGEFEKCTDLMVVKEIRLFLETLEGITSILKSDHILNLFEDLEGRLPDDKDRMLEILRTFIEMPPDRRALYQIGRRLGIFSSLADMAKPQRLARAESAYRQLDVTPDTVDTIIDELMTRYI
jgi:hypothetical protein